MKIDYYKGYRERWWPVLTEDEIAALLDPKNPDSPFHGYIGNGAALEQVADLLYAGFQSPTFAPVPSGEPKTNHCLGPKSLAIFGPASSGKTELVRRIVECMELPLVECDQNTKNADDLFRLISSTCARYGTPLYPVGPAAAGGVLKYKCPPLIAFYDEAHTYKGDWLLKPTEPKDATLIASRAIVDVSQVLWIFGTTHRGKLGHAFDTRCMKIHLEAHTEKEVAEIIKRRYPDYPAPICRKIAVYGRCISRECLAFAEKVRLSAARTKNADYEAVCRSVADREGLDEDGFTRQHLQVLVALYNNKGPLALKRLADQVNEEEITLEEYTLPPLAIQTRDRNPLVRTTSRGLELTPEGIAILNRKGFVKKIGLAARKDDK